jgi:hypothetical protein
VLYVQALDDDGESEMAGAAEFWSKHAATTQIVEVPGKHTGPDSYLSATHVRSTAEALALELAVATAGNAE